MLGPMGSLTLLEKFPVELWGFLRPNQRVIFGQDTGFTFRKEKKKTFIWLLCHIALFHKEMTNLRTLEHMGY